MKEKKIPQLDPKAFPLPDDFFTNQSAILNLKGKQLEDWKVKMGTKPELLFTQPDGYWWKMEEEIRSRLSSNATPVFQPKLKPMYAWAIGSLGTLIIGFTLFFLWNRNNQGVEDWQALLEQTSDSEVLNYILDLPNADKNEVELVANSEWINSEFGLPTVQYSPNQIEQLLEETSDLEEFTN